MIRLNNKNIRGISIKSNIEHSDTKDFWKTRLIMKVYAGSISYGINTENSDVDIRGICIPLIYK